MTGGVIADRQTEIDQIGHSFFGDGWSQGRAKPRQREPIATARRGSTDGDSHATANTGGLSDDDQQLLDRARAASNGQAFAALYDQGDLSAYEGDQSRADLALCGHLAWWTHGDEARIERLFSASALGRREKWRERADYREGTIARAVDSYADRTVPSALTDGVTTAAAPHIVRDGQRTTAELLADVLRFVSRYVVLPGEHACVAVALFVLHTWALAGAHATPYLLVLSAEKRSGKTRLMEVLRQLVRAPWQTTSTTEAAMFRKIAQDTPTLLLDEIDAVFGSNTERTEPLRAVLNAGNRRGSSVTRCVGKSHKVAEFAVFCPKVLAGIDTDKRLPETIRDRSITLRMRRRRDADTVERFRERFAAELAEPIREALSEWGSSAAAELLEMEPSLPDALGDRAADAWEPLFAIADLAGEGWPARARAAAVALSGDGEQAAASHGVLLLAKFRSIFSGNSVVSTAGALASINADDDLPFGGWSDGKGLDSRGLARQLKRFEITPGSVRIGDTTPKGYRAEDFTDAWSRYLPAEAPRAQHPQHGFAASPQIGQDHPRVADVADVADQADKQPAA